MMRNHIAVLLIIAASGIPLPCYGAVSVEIEGVQAELRSNVEAFLSIHRYANTEGLSDAVVRRLHARADGEIRQALEPYGHYNAIIKKSLARDGSNWLAQYDIDPGPPVKLVAITTRITGAGQSEQVFVDAVENAGLRIGDSLSHRQYEEAKSNLEQAAFDLGYLDAQFDERVLEIDAAKNTARVRLVFNTGERYRFGDIRIDQEVIDDDLFQRYLQFAPGEAFSGHKLLNTQYALFDSQYFSTVSVSPGEQQPDALVVPVTVSATARKRNRYSFGAGYATDTQFRFSATWLNRRLNRSGHRFGADLSLSRIREEFNIRHVIPLRRPATDHLTTLAGFRREDLGDTDSERFAVSLAYTRLLGKWQRIVFASLSDETTTFGSEDSTSTLLIPGIAFTRSEVDDPTFTRHGRKLWIEFKGSPAFSGSDASFLQLHMRGNLITPLGENGRLLLRGEFGTSIVDNFQELPASQRFFAGGDHSVRGFDFNDLGPVDADGNVVGGEHVITGSVELEHDLFWKISGAVFTDAGNAMNALFEDIEYSAGVGLRWRSPVGLVRVDVARALSDGSDSTRLHISVGPDF